MGSKHYREHAEFEQQKAALGSLGVSQTDILMAGNNTIRLHELEVARFQELVPRQEPKEGPGSLKLRSLSLPQPVISELQSRGIRNLANLATAFKYLGFTWKADGNRLFSLAELDGLRGKRKEVGLEPSS